MANPILSLAAAGAAISAALHFAAPLVSQFSTDSLTLAPFGIVWALFALGLRNNYRWLLWLAFLAALVGLNVALIGYYAGMTVAPWVLLSVVVADSVVGICLFLLLWRTKALRSEFA